MYGLCKIHKCTTVNDPVPSFRPIFSATGTCNYNLAKFLYQLLNSLLLWNTQSKTFFHFVKKFLTKTQIYLWHLLIFSGCSQIYPRMKRLVFYDNLVFHKKKKVKGMLEQHLKQLLTLYVKSSCFLFNYVYYKKVDGVAVSSPLGTKLANLFFLYYEHKWLEKCPLQF